MIGELQGGWEYIIAAYTITWLFFGGYALSLWLRSVPNTPPSQAKRPLENTQGNTP
jgi:hypothetical protein